MRHATADERPPCCSDVAASDLESDLVTARELVPERPELDGELMNSVRDEWLPDQVRMVWTPRK